MLFFGLPNVCYCHLGVAHPPGYPLFTMLVHGVTRLTRGGRYSLIVFFGDEPVVRRELVDGVWVRRIEPR